MSDFIVKSPIQAVHPGEILREEYLKPLGLSAYALAKELHVPRTRIERLIHEKTPITLDTALRLAKFFHTTAQYWLNIQNFHDVHNVPEKTRNDIATIREYDMAH